MPFTTSTATSGQPPADTPYPAPPLFGDADGYDADGNPRYVAAAELNLGELWSAFSGTARAFRTYLREITRDPDAIDDVVFCNSCGIPTWNDETFAARGNGDSRICESCADDWTSCDRCGDRYPDDELNGTLDDSTVCDGCRSSYYSYCETCEGYYNDADSDDHEHDPDPGGCCTSPQLKFAVRNDGCEPLANDTRVTVTLPAGTISAEGLSAIGTYLRRQSLRYHDLSYYLQPLGDQWQTTTGNFTKRLSRHAYQTNKIKLSPEILSQVGCIAREHSDQVNVAVEVTRNLNLGAEAFYHDDSCWWGSYGESRCALKSNGGFGLRSFDQRGYLSGRAWVMPLRRAGNGRLTPTFDTLTPDAFVIFNGYGNLSGYAAPRIVAHMAGWTYRKIEFSCDPMYVNAGGYLVAPEEIAKQYTDGRLSLSVRQHASLFRTEQAEKAEREASNVRS